MGQREIIQTERLEIYNAIKNSIELHSNDPARKIDYCLSWWINTRNYKWKVSIPTAKINQRCKLLAKHGFLAIIPHAHGIAYRLTDKVFTGDLIALDSTTNKESN